ncbi:MAG: DUF1643 domain-containing protein [Kiritimatiellaceae bacterium]|nr:DUF1643 domain-containing protein [Kiritimatiellaceae bacterium]
MPNFTYAAELKKTFRCYGHFYRLHVKGVEPQLCRSVLEITSLPREAVGAGSDSRDLFDNSGAMRNLPDAVVIMMNPGSSRPIEDGDTDSLLTMPLAAGFQKPLALTQPDNTQYQIMRIMVSRNWNHVRVLNISDLRDPKSPSFIAKTKILAELPGGATHSLFCAERTAERETMLRRKPGAPFILGWGQDSGLIPLAKQCLSRIKGEKIITVPAGNDPVLTAHPSPMMQKKKEEWLAAILAAFAC